MSTTADDNNFDQILAESATPVLVDFWAPWCKPCQALTPILEETEAASGKFRLVKVNIDECEKLAERFNVLSLPTLIIFSGGTPVHRKMGSLSRQALEEWISASLGQVQ